MAVLAPDLAGAFAQAGVDPTRDGRALQNAVRRVIATRHGSCDWTGDHAGRVVTFYSSEAQPFSGRTPELALAWRLMGRMTPGLGMGPSSV